MKQFFINHQEELFTSLITIVVVLILKFIFTKAVKKVGKLGDFDKVRTNLIVKYISLALTVIAIGILIPIWSVNVKDIGAILASVFAVIGVALFAQWSILSNITAGVIIFFSYPFKIGNTIRIFDKEIHESDKNGHEAFVIEDIRAFHLHLRRSNGEILTYPNNMVLQKGISIVHIYEHHQEHASINENID
jgi:small-conductance mechanosensitive channel